MAIYGVTGCKLAKDKAIQHDEGEGDKRDKRKESVQKKMYEFVKTSNKTKAFS